MSLPSFGSKFVWQLIKVNKMFTDQILNFLTWALTCEKFHNEIFFILNFYTFQGKAFFSFALKRPDNYNNVKNGLCEIVDNHNA